MVYPIAKCTILPIHRVWMGKVQGTDNLLKNEPFIIAANHTSYYDILTLPSIIIPKLNKKMSALVNSRYWKNFMAKAFLDLWECIPVFVGKQKNLKEKNRVSLEKAKKYLKDGRILMIFPEGGRSKDGKLKKAYNGIALLALKSEVPVIPAGIIGADKVLPKGKYLPRFKRCEVKIGKPIYFNKFYNKKINKKILDGVTRKIMEEIGKLIGQKYRY